MREMKIKKVVKTFEEFDDDEQAKIIVNYRDINVDYPEWNDWIIEDTINRIKSMTIFDIEADDIIWSVGDRNSHFGIYSKAIIKQMIERFEDKGVYDIDMPEKIGAFLNHRGGGICLQSTTEHGMAKIYFEEDTEEHESQNKAISEHLNEQIDILIDILKERHTANEDAYNHAMSDESVKDTLISNEYEFDTDTMRIC